MAASVVASVALPISNNFSFAPSMDAYGKLSEYGKLGAWSPLSLFAASEVGAWYDPSDLTTMFQDSAGTTPVTADGQPVGKILDKSGRGNHATQATAASRPLYKTDGTYHWLQFDGVDDYLATWVIDFTSTDKVSVFSCSLSNAPNGGIVGGSPLSASFAIIHNSAIRGDLKDTSKVVFASSVGVKYVSAAALDSAQPTADLQIHIRLNGAAAANTVAAATPAVGNQGTYALFLGDWAGALKLNGNIYSIIVRGALSTAAEITATETWVNSKTGAY